MLIDRRRQQKDRQTGVQLFVEHQICSTYFMIFEENLIIVRLCLLRRSTHEIVADLSESHVLFVTGEIIPLCFADRAQKFGHSMCRYAHDYLDRYGPRNQNFYSLWALSVYHKAINDIGLIIDSVCAF